MATNDSTTQKQWLLIFRTNSTQARNIIFILNTTLTTCHKIDHTYYQTVLQAADSSWFPSLCRRQDKTPFWITPRFWILETSSSVGRSRDPCHMRVSLHEKRETWRVSLNKSWAVSSWKVGLPLHHRLLNDGKCLKIYLEGLYFNCSPGLVIQNIFMW